MKKLSITPITNSAQFFPKKGTLEFLQLATREGFSAIIEALIGPTYDPAIVYVLSGVINSGSYPVYAITAGVVYYAGEFFQVDAASYTATGSDVAVFSIDQTQYTTFADPVTLSDASVVNIHDIRKIKTAAGATGSGISDLTQARYLNFAIPALLNLTAPISPAAYADNILQIIGAYPNLGLYVPTPPTNVNPILASGSVNVGNIGGGGSADFTVTFGAPVSTAAYIVLGSWVSNGTPALDATCLWVVRNKTTGGFALTVREDSAVTQNLLFEYVCMKL